MVIHRIRLFLTSRNARAKLRERLLIRAQAVAVRVLKFAPGSNWVDDVRSLRNWSGPVAILDIGAHVGHVTRRLSKEFPECAIHAFEPVASTFEALSQRVANRQNVTVHKLAMSDSGGELEMSSHLAAQTNRVMRPTDQTGSESEAVESTTVDDFVDGLQMSQIGLMKIDTEGYDLLVLRGAERSLRSGRIDLVLAECTWNLRGAPHVDVLEMVRFMRDVGYDVVASYEENVGRFTRGAGHTNVLFAKIWDTSPVGEVVEVSCEGV